MKPYDLATKISKAIISITMDDFPEGRNPHRALTYEEIKENGELYMGLAMAIVDMLIAHKVEYINPDYEPFYQPQSGSTSH